MRQAWLCLGVLAVLLLAGARAAQAAAPVIERVDIGTVRSMGPEQGYPSTGREASVLVRDADGAADVASVQVSYVTAHAGWDGSWEWTQEGPDLVRVSWGPTSAIGSGPAEVTVTDTTGLQSQLWVETPQPPEAEPTMTSPGPGYPVVTDPNVVLAWTGVQTGASNSVTLSRSTALYSWDRLVWSRDLGSDTSVTYDIDGTAVDPQLRPGFRYQWIFSSRVSVDDGVTDPRVHTYFIDELTGQFIMSSDEPVVERADIWRTSKNPFRGPVAYRQGAEITVTDPAGIDPSTVVTVAEPGGAVHSFASFAQSGGEGTWYPEDAYTIRLGYETPDAAEPPAVGTYTITIDRPGRVATVVTPSAPAVPVLMPLDPAPDAVVGSTTPTFSWDSGLSDPLSSLAIVWANDSQWPLWGPYEQPGEQITYPSTGGPLVPGLTYLWEASSVSTIGGGPDDAISLHTNTKGRRRFTIYEPWPSLPEVEGKLAFATRLPSGSGSWADTCLIQQYDPDPWVRRWLGPPNADFPDWSLDGTKLLFNSNGRIWIDRCDGTAPTLVVEDASDPRWSADGAQIVFARRVGWFTADIWVVNADGSEAHPVVENEATKRYPAWSPDGQWVAYGSLSSSDPSTDGVWLVRPDGAEPHHLLPSGVQGYPDYAVTYLGQPGWAPDAGRLVVTFSASSSDPDAPGLRGLGVVGRDGGLLKPVFLTPEGVVCCAEPKLPVWSGAGTKIAFSSAHHLPVNPSWAGGAFESGVELWMINADGSGELTRLTYNPGFDGTSSWWAPPPFPDVPKGHWAYCAVSTCAQAGLVEGFPGGNYQPSLAVTRDQMAVYIARALAGGDDHVPSGPAAATFGDVDQEHWAYNYVEYCAANGIVQGYWGETYHPDEVVTRDQMAVYVSRAIATPTGEAGLTGYTGPDTPSFTDVGADHWAYRYIEYAKEHGVVQGYWDGRYQPALPVTRDQMAMYIARAFHLPM